MFFRHCFLALGLPCALFSAYVRAAAPLALDEARALALQDQPALLAWTYAAEGARQAAVAEAPLPDPKLTLGVQNLPATGAPAFQLDADGMTMVTVGVMQEMVRAPKRAAAARGALAEAEQAVAAREALALAIARDAGLVWIDAFAAERRTALLQRLADEMRAEREVAASALPSGKTLPGEILQLDALLAMTVDKRLAAARDATKARAALARWIGDAAERPLGPDRPLFTPPERPLAAAMLAQHPVLQMELRAEEIARLGAERARAERRPDWSWELMYGKRPADGANLVSLQVSTGLPWDRARRQDRRLAAELAGVERTRAQTADRRRELAAEFDAAWIDWAAASSRAKQHERALIPAARARAETAQAAYAAGQASLAAVWEARRGLIDVELEHEALRADQARAAVRIEYLTGRAEP